MAMLLKVDRLTLDFALDRRSAQDGDASGRKRILSEISLQIEEGQVLGLVGESGSGKSVTAQALLGLIERPPLAHIEGGIEFAGRDLLTLPRRELNRIRGREIGFVPQEPMSALNPVYTIGEQLIELLRQHRNERGKGARRRAAALLAEVGIPDPDARLDCFPHELSGGMRQRAMIAMAVSCDPRLIIADEPTTALDVTIQAQILALFKRLQRERQMAMLFITHDLRVIAELADSVCVMRGGRVLESAPVQQLFAAPSDPYTRELLELIPGHRHEAVTK